jgi:predicted DNA-binding transcriptional regulator AlpA
MESKQRVKQPNFSAALWDIQTSIQYVNLSRSTWLKMVALGQAPKPRQLPGARSVRWSAEEVRNWVGGLQNA